MREVLALHGHVRRRRGRHAVMVRRLDLLLPVLQAEDVVRLQMILLNHLLRVVTDVVVMGEGPPRLLLLLLLLLLMLLLMLQLLLVPLGPRRVPLTAAAAAAPLVPVVGVDIPRVPRLLMWRPVTISTLI